MPEKRKFQEDWGKKFWGRGLADRVFFGLNRNAYTPHMCLSKSMTITNRASVQQKVQVGICAHQRLRTACTSAQSDQSSMGVLCKAKRLKVSSG